MINITLVSGSFGRYDSNHARHIHDVAIIPKRSLRCVNMIVCSIV